MEDQQQQERQQQQQFQQHQQQSEQQQSDQKHLQPITGPSPAGPEWLMEASYDRPLSPSLVLGRFLLDFIRKPVIWYRENVVLPNKGPKYYYYHKKYNRPMPIDECYIDDFACTYEANIDFKRTHMVDKAVLDLLRQRRDGCWYWYTTKRNKTYPNPEECREMEETYDREETNFHIKYGDLPFRATVLQAYTRQKHRMIMERRIALREARGEGYEPKPE